MAYYDFNAQGTGNRAYYLGELAHGVTMDVASKYDDYANLTADNFVIVPQTNSTSAQAYSEYHISPEEFVEFKIDNNTGTYTQPSINYNASTGTLSFTSTLAVGGQSFNGVSGTGQKWNYSYPSGSVGLTAKVYLLPEIENL